MWHENGHKKSESTWVDGKQHGLLHRSGTGPARRSSEATFVDDKLNGLTTKWDENGQKTAEATYVDGELQ